MNSENTDQYPLYTNDLIYESSPYLKQHANNPVNWKTWNKKTLNEDLDASISALIKLITKAFITEDGQIKRTINQKGESINGFLDDYAFTMKKITSLLDL